MQRFHLHLVSDATGETLSAVVKAGLAQFEGFDAVEHFHAMVRTPKHMDLVLQAIQRSPGLVMFTLVDRSLREQLEEGCRNLGILSIAVLDPVMDAFGRYLGAESMGRPGQQHEMNAEYFTRIEAMSFTMAHDDGLRTDDLHQADVILLGVSRTSKTPTSIYLANRGIKVANVPVVPGLPLPEELDGLKRPLIVALTVSPDRLVHIRRSRMRALSDKEDSSYADPEAVADEITAARRVYLKRGWPIIDVTRRSIEETAAAIYSLYQRRQEELAAS
ncbi:MAG: pyruvate, phosphate dikinase/phosphoenolpyruvate synthase regulator [Alphaproteobacteria bacterium]|nr:pyruvate, phosphate dikinase/phosphoenolpyruvate synthase regulator [Alphaproteobacteria bacterium]